MVAGTRQLKLDGSDYYSIRTVLPPRHLAAGPSPSAAPGSALPDGGRVSTEEAELVFKQFT